MSTKGSGSGVGDLERLGTTNEEIYKIIGVEVAAKIREAILNMFVSIKTMFTMMFDKCYGVIIEVTIAPIAATGLPGGGSMQYREFSNMKPMEFDGVKDATATMGWIFEFEGCMCDRRYGLVESV